MCMGSTPKVQQLPVPPPPPSPVVEAQATIDAKGLERRRAAARSGRQSTILAGNETPTAPTSQAKTVLGS